MTTEAAATVLTDRQERAIALRENISTDAAPAALVPSTFAEAQSFAGALASSNLVPAALRERAPDILMIMLSGAELGLPPMASLRSYHVIEGIPRLSADAIAAVCTRSPLCEYLEPAEISSTSVTWRGKRRGRPEVPFTFTLEEAKNAGVAGNKNWQRWPVAMMNARCKSQLARMLWPELCAGLISNEEVGDGFALDGDAPAPTGFVASTPTPETPKRGPGRPPKEASVPTPSATVEQPSAAASKIDDAAAKAREADAVRAAKAKADAEAKAEHDRAEEARAAAAAKAATPPAEDDGFGEDPAPAAATPRTPAELYTEFLTDVQNATKATIESVKSKWVPMSKVGEPLNEYAPRMRETFARRKAELGA